MNATPDPGIAVLALNPAVDISYEIQQLVADRKVRAESTRYHPGGNGINVARSLAELDMPFRCCSVVGGESGDLLLRLLGDRLGGNHSIFRVEGETRVNATLLQKSPRSQYEVDSSGPVIPSTVLEDLTGCFLSGCGSGIGVLTGSVPPGVPDDHLRRLAKRIKEQGGRVVLDAHGAVLQKALQSQPYLVRLNRYVLEMVTKRSLESIEVVAAAARELQQRGIGIVCISLGPDGAILADADNSYHCTAPRMHVQSTVGCGDALVAGLVTAASRGEDSRAMLRLGVICGSATASYPGTELFKREDIADLDARVELTMLGI
ncbi:MAG: hexose kinase [Gammaproteobacteria bacterium]|jgi:6-phosphofructokinase 2